MLDFQGQITETMALPIMIIKITEKMFSVFLFFIIMYVYSSNLLKNPIISAIKVNEIIPNT